MERYQVIMTAQAPLCFNERRPAEQFRASTGYVPGTVLRGAVASRMVEDGQADTAAFQRLFVHEHPAIFSNGYVAPSVLPATAMSCKAEKGFRRDGKHGVRDTLVERLCVEAFMLAGLLYMPSCSQARGSQDECRSRLERYEGFYRQDGGDLRSVRVTQRLLTRVAINRRRATAEDELLYSPLVISEAQRPRDDNYRATEFTATVTVPAHADVLGPYLRQVDRLGSGTSRGLGAVQIEATLDPVDDTAELAALQQRREAFNAAIRESWQTVARLPGCSTPAHSPERGAYFSLSLRADAVLKADGWLPTHVLTDHMLRERCPQVEDDSLLVVRAYSGYDWRGGWNVAWGLPKDVDVVVLMGSVFVFWTEHPERWDEALLDVERWGVGERIAEGFGQVLVCDAFHVQAQGVLC